MSEEDLEPEEDEGVHVKADPTAMQMLGCGFMILCICVGIAVIIVANKYTP